MLNPTAPQDATQHASNDHAILDAFAARRSEFEATYDTDMTRDEEDGYFARLDASERVIGDTPATSIEGVLAKLRIAFMHQVGSAWSDRAIMDPTHPDFVAGLAEADMYTRMKWSAIEDLARIGGVDLAKQGLATVEPLTPLESLRLQYLALHEASLKIASAEDEPKFAVLQAKMVQIEEEMTARPSRSLSDAKVKVRFMLDTNAIGVPLDGGEAHILIKDAARFLLGHAAVPTKPATSTAEWDEAMSALKRECARSEADDSNEQADIEGDARTRVLQMPAPHADALAWKIEYFFSPDAEGYIEQFAHSYVKQTLIDAVRLAGGTPSGMLA